jgi:hypothetical protein
MTFAVISALEEIEGDDISVDSLHFEVGIHPNISGDSQQKNHLPMITRVSELLQLSWIASKSSRSKRTVPFPGNGRLCQSVPLIFDRIVDFQNISIDKLLEIDKTSEMRVRWDFQNSPLAILKWASINVSASAICDHPLFANAICTSQSKAISGDNGRWLGPRSLLSGNQCTFNV